MLRSRHQGLSAAPCAPSAPLYFAANGERPAGASEGLTVWGPLLQADPTTEVAGSFKIEPPGAVCKMKRCLNEAEGVGRNAEDLMEGSPVPPSPTLTASSLAPRVGRSFCSKVSLSVTNCPS